MTRSLNIILANSGRKWIGEVGHCDLLYHALEARGHKAWMLCRRGSKLEKHAAATRMRFVSLEYSSRFSPTNDFRDWREIVDLIRREKIDVVHCHRGKDHWSGALAGRWTHTPVVRTRHVVVPVHQHVFNRWLYRRATAATIAVSEASSRSLGGLAEGLPNHRVILSAVDAEKFRPELRDPERRLEPLGSPGGAEPIWIGLIGRIQKVKGQAVFLKAARLIAEKVPEARFLITGRGGKNKRARFAQLAEQWGFGDRTVVCGKLPNLPEVMASLDIGVIASLGSEGSSRVALELMASGVPIVATRVGGIPEFLEPDGRADENRLGELIEAGDHEALAEAILRVLDDQKSARTRAGAAIEAARTTHSPERWAEQVENVYLEALGRGR